MGKYDKKFYTQSLVDKIGTLKNLESLYVIIIFIGFIYNIY